jgi:hypothetical protein
MSIQNRKPQEWLASLLNIRATYFRGSSFDLSLDQNNKDCGLLPIKNSDQVPSTVSYILSNWAGQ